MIFKTIFIFFKTWIYFLRTLFKSTEQINLVKQQWATYLLTYFKYEIRISGIQPQTNKTIIVGNHVSYLDILVLLHARPNAVFIAKDDILKWPIIGAAAKSAGTIFVNRESGAKRNSTKQQIEKILHQNKNSIVVFPSGTTTLDEHKVWKKGIFKIAIEQQIKLNLFRIEYEPLRASAYIDQDTLFFHVKNLFRIQNKKVTLHWLGEQTLNTDPLLLAEISRQKVFVSKNRVEHAL
jgi:1-acyl-sn-glycerol-3-phosphate acyltransferase